MWHRDQDSDCMNAKHLAIRIAEQHQDLTIEQSEQLVKIVLKGIAKGISEGNRTEIRGFGSFTPKVYPPTMKRNPKTGEKVAKGFRGRSWFKPGKKLKDLANGS